MYGKRREKYPFTPDIVKFVFDGFIMNYQYVSKIILDLYQREFNCMALHSDSAFTPDINAYEKIAFIVYTIQLSVVIYPPLWHILSK